MRWSVRGQRQPQPPPQQLPPPKPPAVPPLESFAAAAPPEREANTDSWRSTWSLAQIGQLTAVVLDITSSSNGRSQSVQRY